MRREGRPLLFVLLGWLVIAAIVGVTGYFRNVGAIGVAATVWGLTILLLLAIWRIPFMRAGATALDLRSLVALHLTRIVGLDFLILASRGELAEGFARPAGIGDIATALGALLLLLIWRGEGAARRPYLIAWNTFGLLDILFVVANALRFGLRDLQSMAPLRELPLSLLPTFLVPLIIASHVLIFVRLRQKL